MGSTIRPASNVNRSLWLLRERAGQSRTAAAMALGWNYRRLKTIECGSRQPTYAEVIVLLGLYGATWHDLAALFDSK